MGIVDYYLDHITVLEVHIQYKTVRRYEYDINQEYIYDLLRDYINKFHNYLRISQELDESDICFIIRRDMYTYINNLIREQFREKIKAKFDDFSSERCQIQKKYIVDLINIFERSPFVDGGEEELSEERRQIIFSKLLPLMA